MFDSLNERDRTILSKLAEHGSLSVVTLAQDLGLSEVTIRSDLKSLAERGLLNRTRGGAEGAINRNILERQNVFSEQKTQIARAAAEMVSDGDVIMIEAGTTTALIAKFLSGKRDVHVVSNSNLAFSHARLNPALRLSMIGGEFSRSTESFAGSMAIDSIARLQVKFAFVGTDGFSLARGITTHLMEGSEIIRAMHAHAQQTILVADSSKYGKIGFASILPLEDLSLIITDNKLSAQSAAELESAGVRFRLV